MDYYELPAEGRGYYMFDHRPLMNAKAHFHSAVEFIFMEKGYAEVNVGGERRLLSAGGACFAGSFPLRGEAFYQPNRSSSSQSLT